MQSELWGRNLYDKKLFRVLTNKLLLNGVFRGSFRSASISTAPQTIIHKSKHLFDHSAQPKSNFLPLWTLMMTSKCKILDSHHWVHYCIAVWKKRKKNFFIDIFLYEDDHSRIILKDYPETDYINASLVEYKPANLKYILTQVFL